MNEKTFYIVMSTVWAVLAVLVLIGAIIPNPLTVVIVYALVAILYAEKVTKEGDS